MGSWFGRKVWRQESLSPSLGALLPAPSLPPNPDRTPMAHRPSLTLNSSPRWGSCLSTAGRPRPMPCPCFRGSCPAAVATCNLRGDKKGRKGHCGGRPLSCPLCHLLGTDEHVLLSFSLVPLSHDVGRAKKCVLKAYHGSQLFPCGGQRAKQAAQFLCSAL